MLLLVNTLKIANSASFAGNLLWSELFVFCTVIAMCLSIIVFIVSANKSFITLYVCYPLNISALYDHPQVDITTHTERPLPRYSFPYMLWYLPDVGPKLPKHIADNSWMCSALNVMLALAKKFGPYCYDWQNWSMGGSLIINLCYVLYKNFLFVLASLILRFHLYPQLLSLLVYVYGFLRFVQEGVTFVSRLTLCPVPSPF